MAGNEEARSGPAGRRRAGSAFRPQQITSQLASYPSDSPVPWRQVILVGQDQSEVLDAVLSGRADVGCRAVSASLQSGFSVATLARSTRLPAPPTGTSYSDTGASGGSCRTLHHRPVPLRRATRTHLPCELSNSRPCARAPRPGRLVRTGFVEGTAGRSRRGLLKYVHVLPARADFPLPFSTTVRRPAAAPAMHPDEPTRIRACA